MVAVGGGQWRRRTFVRAVVSSATVPWTGCGREGGDGDAVPEPSPPDLREGAFPQGIASGDPSPDGVLLWARVEPPSPAATIVVRWALARDEDFDDVVTGGELTAEAAHDHTVRVRVVDLEPYVVYHYRFTAELPQGEITSETGRTKTAPTPEMDVPVRFAFASCQEYVGRWYHAWRLLAEQSAELDFVLFLGDYIYETIADPRYQPLGSPRSLALPDGLSLDGSATNLAALTLADYRALYRQYRSDPDLRRIHAQVPFLIAWDDHEFANDGWQDVANEFDGAQGLERNTARREAATRAWFEHLPVDVPFSPDAGFPEDIVTYRGTRWGRHAELFLTDQRYYRDDHLIPEDEAEIRVGKLMPNTALGSRVFALKAGFDELEAATPPSMLGAAQREWLVGAMRSSTAAWKLWGSALMVAQLVLDLREVAEAPALLRNVFYFKVDQWDGFRTERAALLEALAGTPGVVVLSGDLHGNYVAELRRDFDDPTAAATATEFTVAGISSISLQEQLDLFAVTDPTLAATGLAEVTHLFDENLRSSGPHFVYANSRAYGFGLVEIDGPDELRVWLHELSDVTDPVAVAQVVPRGFRLVAGTHRPAPI